MGRVTSGLSTANMTLGKIIGYSTLTEGVMGVDVRSIRQTHGWERAGQIAIGSAQTAVSVVAITSAISKPKYTYQIKTRTNPGGDGGVSSHIIERESGTVISKTHQVRRSGKLVHQHQDHIGKYGNMRSFPDEWVQNPKIKE